MGEGRDWKLNIPELRVGAAESSETRKGQTESIGGLRHRSQEVLVPAHLALLGHIQEHGLHLSYYGNHPGCLKTLLK